MKKVLAGTTSGGIKIAPDTIAFCPSGLIDQNKNMVLSYLHKAIKPVNQLRMIEDATVIYRIARAPERRIFKIDVGNLPKVKANNIYEMLWQDIETNLSMTPLQVKSEMTETICLCWKIFGYQVEKVVEVQILLHYSGGQNLGEIQDIEYFRAKLYRSLNVPASRLEASQGFNLGRSTEITRDELKFTKFVQRLRKKFTELFNDILKTQLILKARYYR